MIQSRLLEQCLRQTSSHHQRIKVEISARESAYLASPPLQSKRNQLRYKIALLKAGKFNLERLSPSNTNSHVSWSPSKCAREAAKA
jgi:hypothetical protein